MELDAEGVGRYTYWTCPIWIIFDLGIDNVACGFVDE
jgi:hypothetical protein